MAKPAPRQKASKAPAAKKKAAARSKSAVAKKAAPRPKPATPLADPLIDALAACPIGAVISRPSDGRVLYANAAICAFFGITARQALGRKTGEFFAEPADRAPWIETLRKGKGTQKTELRFRAAGEVEKMCLVSATLVTFAGDTAILTWLEDETERKAREVSLQSAARQVELVHRIAGIANRAVNFYDALRQGSAEIAAFLAWPARIVYRLVHGQANQLEVATFSFAKELPDQQAMKDVLLGKTFAPGEDVPGRVLAEKASVWLAGGAALSRLPRFAGESRRLIGSVLAVPVVADETVVAVLEFLTPDTAEPDELLRLTFERLGLELGRVYLRDLTTVALQEARAEAESSARAKANFLAAMSHEVRTPMNGVVGMVDLLLQTRLNADQRQMLQTVKDSGQALLKVINDILDFSKIDAGRLEIEAADVSLLKVVEDVAASLTPTAMQKGLRIVTFVDPRLPETVVGDAVRIRQILSNLAGNAVKFSDLGEIVIKAERMDGAGDDLRVRFSVKDQGIGITPEAQRRLFEEFSQADTSTTRKFGGTGLGLAIVYRLTKLMGGEIAVDSAPGQGATFFCTLPFVAPPGAAASQPADLSGLRVLVAAGSREVREACRTYLTYWNTTVLMAEQLRDCLPAYQNTSAQGKPIDIIVLPDIDDPPQLAALRQAFIDKGLMPYPRFVIGRDPLRLGQTWPKLEEVTFLDVNPMRRAGLITAVAIAAGRASPEPYRVEMPLLQGDVRVPTVEEARAAGRLILFAEDHAANREVLRRQLARLGYACEIANDGKIALRMWQEKDYALLLTDCHMPELDGFGLTAAIRQQEAESGGRKPIIAITANALQGEAERCLAAGMDDFLPKPVELRVLQAMLEKWMPGGGPAPVLEDAPGPEEDRPIVLDLSIMRDTFGEINDDARQMFGLFVDSIRPLIVRYDEELAASQMTAACETIHKARGAVANAGGRELAAIMGEVEGALRENKFERARRRSAEIAPAWDRLLRAIAAV